MDGGPLSGDGVLVANSECLQIHRYQALWGYLYRPRPITLQIPRCERSGDKK